MEALPPAILALVLTAAGPDSAPALRLTCRSLLDAVDDGTRSLAFHRASAVRTLATFPCLKELDVSSAPDCTDSWLAGVASQAPQLESLKLGAHHRLTHALAHLLPRQLRQLDLTGCPLHDDGALAVLLARLQRLQSLTLRECGGHASAGALAALGTLRHLRDLDLSSCRAACNATLEQLAAGCPQLTKLNCSSCELVGEPGLRHLSRLPALHTLLLSGCHQLTDGCLLAIAEGLPALECLSLFEAGENVTDAGLAHLACLSGSLTALDLGYAAWDHTSAGLEHLLARLPRLQMLNIGGCEGTCDAAVAAAARHCSQLTFLDVSESQRLTGAGLQPLAQLPNLQVLNLGWNIRLEALPALPPSITRIDLSFAQQLGDGTMATLAAAALPRLASLALRKCSGVGDGGLALLARATALTHLDLSYCSAVTAAGVAKLAALPRLASLALVDCLRAVHPPCMRLLAERFAALQALDLSQNARMDDGCMQALSHMPQLRSLSLNCCPKVSHHGLNALTRIARLRHLRVERCPQLTADALERLQRKLVLLRVAGEHPGDDGGAVGAARPPATAT